MLDLPSAEAEAVPEETITVDEVFSISSGGSHFSVDSPPSDTELAGVKLEQNAEDILEMSDAEDPPLPLAFYLHKYFISVTGYSRKRRLHLGGECWRVPGRDYSEFSEHGDSLPGPPEYHAACKQCFPAGVGGQSSASSSDGSSETSESESK